MGQATVKVEVKIKVKIMMETLNDASATTVDAENSSWEVLNNNATWRLDDELAPNYLKLPLHMMIIYTLAYSTIFCVGVVGNGLLICLVSVNRSMQTVTNFFIVNLAVADILVCFFCLPITLITNLYSGEVI